MSLRACIDKNAVIIPLCQKRKAMGTAQLRIYSAVFQKYRYFHITFPLKTALYSLGAQSC